MRARETPSPLQDSIHSKFIRALDLDNGTETENSFCFAALVWGSHRSGGLEAVNMSYALGLAGC